MNADKTKKPPAVFLLSEGGTIVGYTRDEIWSGQWCQMDSGARSASAVPRIDRPPALKPLPTITIHFDGGCRPTNPGNRYGSFRVTHLSHPIFQNERIEFGWGTNNEAEFLALLAGLDWSLIWLESWSKKPAKDYRVHMVTDATLVEGRVNGKNKAVKTEAQQRMAAMTEQVMERLRRFGQYQIEWRARANNVAMFGH